MDIGKVGKIVVVPCKGNFFRWWFEILKPIHHLTNRECDVISAFAEKRYELSKSIMDKSILDNALMGDEYREEIRAKIGISIEFFWVLIGKLRKKGIIVGNTINPKYIPPINGDKPICLTFIFKDENR